MREKSAFKGLHGYGKILALPVVVSCTDDVHI